MTLEPTPVYDKLAAEQPRPEFEDRSFEALCLLAMTT